MEIKSLDIIKRCRSTDYAIARIEGKFIVVGNEKFYIRGVTYGTFHPDEVGSLYPSKEIIEKDFAMMREHGINTVRTYTVPPLYVLDIAARLGLKLMIGLPWEQHIAFLDSTKRRSDILKRVKNGVTACAQHPAVLCYAIGNEIPASIVRWYGKRRIEKFLQELYFAVKRVDEHALVTYVNYPTTEYLELPFLDFNCFNVYLETKEKLNAYVQRLHNLTGDRPLVLAEIGLDSIRNGVERQAEVLAWQLETIFAKGCAGAFVFAWTDEWWRGGFEIDDWDFGLVTRNREYKPALHAVSKAYSKISFSDETKLPFISVVVCSYNGSATIRDCMEGLLQLDYPNFEVIVVDDGSTDDLRKIVNEYPFRVISTSNSGLSNARNTGLHAAKGEIIAYIDDDAYPDKHWLRYLSYAYLTTSHAGFGGPNIAPENGHIASCVANSPGGPVHVLLDDEIAEHIPGCNMSFRKDALLEVGGFDPIFRAAGDDVDLCWRIQHTGKTIGYHPSAFVWHHRRNSVKAYWKQQKGYGKAEALLEAKWPEKYNGFGHLSWSGRIYGNGTTLPIKLKKDKIFHGIWGSSPFQSLYQIAPNFISSIPLMPEWYLLIAVLGFLSILGFSWSILLWIWPISFIALSTVFVQAGISASKALSSRKDENSTQYLKYWSLTTFLHVIQPIARLYGRIAHGLTPWRKRGSDSYGFNALFIHRKILTHWSEKWRSSEDWITKIESNLIKSKTRVRRGGPFDKWDLQASSGVFSGCRSLLTIEEHGGGKQLLRFRYWPKYSHSGIALGIFLTILSALAAFDQAYLASAILAFFVIAFAAKYFTNTARAIFDLSKAFSLLSAPANVPEPVTEIVNTGSEVAIEENIYPSPLFNGTRVILQNEIDSQFIKKAFYRRKKESNKTSVIHNNPWVAHKKKKEEST